MEIGLGQMGMSTADFDNITVCEFVAKQRGFFELEKIREKQQWNRTIALINIQLPRGQKIDADRIFDKKPVKVMTKEEFETLIKKLDKYHVTGKSQFPVSG